MTAFAIVGLSATLAVANDSTVSDDAVFSSEVTDSPTPSESPTGTIDPTFSPEPTPDVTPDVENTPQGKAYGWWRNHGVLIDKPGNGPKPNEHAEENAGE